MDLETFILEVLKQTHNALKGYKEQTGYNFVVSNDRINLSEEGINGEITFDIALTQSSSQEGKAKAGLIVASVGIGGEGKLIKTDENVNRIKFTIRLTKIEEKK